MASLWMPGVTRQSQDNGGGMVGGPPRAVWHITWDELGKGGALPAFDSVARYLREVGYCPHLMWDPWTGRTVQFYAADESARALVNAPGGVETNRMGSHCIQVEAWFSPGCVRDGRKYATLADTPCIGLDTIVEWMRGLGIPDVWPSGWPKWSGNSRSAITWRTRPGHYGHAHVPENDHEDPGPMPTGMFSGAGDWMETIVNKLPTLGRGDIGEAVQTLQGLLLARSHPEIKIDGSFGDSTEKAVRAVQRWGGVSEDGVVGPATWPVLILRERTG